VYYKAWRAAAMGHVSSPFDIALPRSPPLPPALPPLLRPCVLRQKKCPNRKDHTGLFVPAD
jgi:hypothetical protein